MNFVSLITGTCSFVMNKAWKLLPSISLTTLTTEDRTVGVSNTKYNPSPRDNCTGSRAQKYSDTKV